MICPRPVQVGHVRSTVKKPCCARTFPMPEHVGQVDGSAPPFAPDPLHVSQATELETEIFFWFPVKASSNVMFRLYRRSDPRFAC